MSEFIQPHLVQFPVDSFETTLLEYIQSYVKMYRTLDLTRKANQMNESSSLFPQGSVVSSRMCTTTCTLRLSDDFVYSGRISPFQTGVMGDGQIPGHWSPFRLPKEETSCPIRVRIKILHFVLSAPTQFRMTFRNYT